MNVAKVAPGSDEWVHVDTDVVHHPRNPRRGNLALIKESILANGFVGAITVQAGTRHVIAGNHRLRAARELGITHVPARVVQVDDATALRVVLADNRTADMAEYDPPELQAVLAELADDGDLLGTGYTQADVDAMIAEANGGGAGEPGHATDPDDVPDAPVIPRTQVGDVYLMGAHRLVCGDCTVGGVIMRVAAVGGVDLLWTDPPYNVAYKGKTSDALTIQNDAQDDAAFRDFLVRAFRLASVALRDGGVFYVAHGDTEGFNFRGAVRDVGWKLAQCLIWAKDVFVMGRQDYHWKHEPILYGWKLGAGHHVLADRTQHTIWEFPRPRRSEEHPTMKPVALIERAIRNSTNLGAVVLDPFAGSGSTLIACEGTGRVAQLVELDPRYCDVIVGRWQAATGKVATLVRDGVA